MAMPHHVLICAVRLFGVRWVGPSGMRMAEVSASLAQWRQGPVGGSSWPQVAHWLMFFIVSPKCSDKLTTY